MPLDSCVPTYGQRFQIVRMGKDWAPGKKPRLTQRKVAEALGYVLPAPVSPLEKLKRLPKPQTIQEHAVALKCEPWELLLGVPTVYDELRWPSLSVREIEDLLAGFQLLPSAQRTAVLQTCAKAVRDAGPLFLIESPSTRKSKIETPAIGGNTSRRKTGR